MSMKNLIKPYAGSPQIRVGEGCVAPAATLRHLYLLCKKIVMTVAIAAMWSGYADKVGPDGEDKAKDADTCVFSAFGKPYRMRAMLSDAEIMLRSKMKSVEGTTDADRYPYNLILGAIKEGRIGDREVVMEGLKPMAKAAAVFFVKKNLLLDRASKLGVIGVSAPKDGHKESVLDGENGYTEILFGDLQATIGPRIREILTKDRDMFNGTSVAMTDAEALAISELIRREVMPKVRGGDEKQRRSSEESHMMDYIERLKVGMDAPFDCKGCVEAAFAHEFAKKTDGARLVVPVPKLKSRLVRIPGGINCGADSTKFGSRGYRSRMEHDVEMDATEVTSRDWKAVKEWAEANGYEFICEGFANGDDYPIADICWYDCLRWCNARSEAEGLEPVYLVDGEPFRKGAGRMPHIDTSKTGYRLPTIEEWQYAARGGEKGFLFPWGDTISHENANYYGMSSKGYENYDLSVGAHPKFRSDYGGGMAAPVASFKANGFGLYDMAGNVWEFSQDPWREYTQTCGGGFDKGGFFARIKRCNLGPLCSDGSRSVGFRTMRRVRKTPDGREINISVNNALTSRMAEEIKVSRRYEKKDMEKQMDGMLTFPSLCFFQSGVAWSVGDYMLVWYKRPALEIDANADTWIGGLGKERYEVHKSKLRESELSYLHSFALYDPQWGFGWINGGGVPIPIVVFTVETSRHGESCDSAPFVCAFTPHGRVNFGRSNSLTDDGGAMLNVLFAIKEALGLTPEKIGTVAEGFNRFRKTVRSKRLSAGVRSNEKSPDARSRDKDKDVNKRSQSTSSKVVAVDDSRWQGGFSEDWFVNWDKALAEAKKTGKAMFILHDGSDWCPWSKRLKKEVFDKPEFVEFARKNLVLLLLDNPSRNLQRKDQAEHNQLIVRTLPFGKFVPYACVMNVKGEKLGSIDDGGGINLDQYLDKLSRIMGNKGEAITGENVKRLFSNGYASFAAHVAAIRASWPPFNEKDFKVKVTGVARMADLKQLGKESDLEFLPPETPVEVPFGTVVVFRVEYDFPRGYKANVTLNPESCDDGESHFNFFHEKGSRDTNGKGTAYACLYLRERGRTCNLKKLSISLGAKSELEFDNLTRIWPAGEIPVNLMFKKNPANTDDEYSSVPSNTKIVFRNKSFDEKTFVPPAVSTSVPRGWMEDFEAAKRQAAKKNKFVLVAFTGSDWCKWSKKMYEEVFSKEEFVKEASKKYVLVMIDIPDDDIILSKIAKKQNEHLSKRFSVSCYPTMVILNPNGSEVKRHSGYRKGGPQGYVDYLDDLLRK